MADGGPTFSYYTPIRSPVRDRPLFNWWSVGYLLKNVFHDMYTSHVRDFLLDQNPLDELRFLPAPNLHSKTSTCFGIGSWGSDCPAFLLEEVSFKIQELDDDHDIGLPVRRFSGIGDVDKHVSSPFVYGRIALNRRMKRWIRVSCKEACVQVVTNNVVNAYGSRVCIFFLFEKDAFMKIFREASPIVNIDDLAASIRKFTIFSAAVRPGSAPKTLDWITKHVGSYITENMLSHDITNNAPGTFTRERPQRLKNHHVTQLVTKTYSAMFASATKSTLTLADSVTNIVTTRNFMLCGRSLLSKALIFCNFNELVT